MDNQKELDEEKKKKDLEIFKESVYYKSFKDYFEKLNDEEKLNFCLNLHMENENLKDKLKILYGKNLKDKPVGIRGNHTRPIKKGWF